MIFYENVKSKIREVWKKNLGAWGEGTRLNKNWKNWVFLVRVGVTGKIREVLCGTKSQ